MRDTIANDGDIYSRIISSVTAKTDCNRRENSPLVGRLIVEQSITYTTLQLPHLVS